MNNTIIRLKKIKKTKKFIIIFKICIFTIILIAILFSIYNEIFRIIKKRKKNIFKNEILKKIKLKNEKIINDKNIIEIESKYNLTLLNRTRLNKYNLLDVKLKKRLKSQGLEYCFLNNKEEDYCIYPLLIPKKVIGRNLTLVGPKKDGGYVLLDDFENIRIAYSFGIFNDTSFDFSLAEKKIDIYMYDHTISSLPCNNSKFHWKKIGLSGNKKKNNNLKTLKELLIENGHINEKNMILKIDVENSEWEAISDISDDILKKFKYIIIEYHFWKDKMPYYYSILKKLLNNHQIIYTHCNGCGEVRVYGNNVICSALEVTYVIKDNYQFSKDDSIYPIKNLEVKNCGRLSKYDLNLIKLFAI